MSTEQQVGHLSVMLCKNSMDWIIDQENNAEKGIIYSYLLDGIIT